MKALSFILISVAGGALGAYLLAVSLFSQGVNFFGATTARTTITNPWTFSATTTAANITITTTNAATSTLQVGCIQMTATSTASQFKLVIAQTGTTTKTYGHGTIGYFLLAVPGNCPRI